MIAPDVQQQVKILVNLLMQRPITESVAQQVETYPGFEHLEIMAGEWIGLSEGDDMGGEEHRWIESLIITMLTNWALANKSGRVYTGDTNFVLDGTPDNIRLKRCPDVAFVRNANVRPSKGFIYAAPDLAVEIISPSKRPGQIRQKLNDYLDHGAGRVWQIYPDTREVVVYQPDRSSKTYRVADTLTDDDLLPGFSLNVASLFE